MLKIKEIYDLPFKAVPLTGYVFRAQWLPELPNIEDGMTSSVLQALDAAARVQVRELVYRNVDGERIVQMHTVYFDNKPVFIVQDAGRGGRDHQRRWITDAAQCGALIAYLHVMLETESPSQDLADPEAQVFEEEFFQFYGMDFSEQFGYKCEERAPGYALLGVRALLPTENARHQLVFVAKGSAPAPYIRRGPHVFRLDRAVTEADTLKGSPAFAAHCRASDAHLYLPCERPASETVLSV